VNDGNGNDKNRNAQFSEASNSSTAADQSTLHIGIGSQQAKNKLDQCMHVTALRCKNEGPETVESLVVQ